VHPSFTASFKRVLIRISVVAMLCIATASLMAAQEDGRKLKTRVEPTCPEVARKFNIGGTVRLEITVARSGEVKTIKAIGGHPVLIDSAMSAVREWRYEPSTQETTTTVEIKFTPGA